MKIEELINNFDSFLEERGLHFDAIIIGGAALNLLGITSRYTRDCDILDPTIPEAIIKAAKLFAEENRKDGNPLTDDWINNGPQDLKKHLPAGWRKRIVSAFKGKALSLSALGRSDLLKTKIFAYCDRGTDRNDCLLLKPTLDELKAALPWVKEQDANPDWPKHVENSIQELAKTLGYEL